MLHQKIFRYVTICPRAAYADKAQGLVMMPKPLVMRAELHLFAAIRGMNDIRTASINQLCKLCGNYEKIFWNKLTLDFVKNLLWTAIPSFWKYSLLN